MTVPLLFLDVDGPLIPFGSPSGYRSYGEDGPNPLLSRLDPGHGARLLGLGYALVWATTWSSDANVHVGPRLGLPDLPVVEWPEEDELVVGLHWKTRTLVEWAAGRDFAWVDDELTAADRAWVATHHPGRALLHRIDARTGLTPADYHTLRSWHST
ncbi:MAG: hypothetical protein HOY71_20480 [Nonomuraea sp.]|nr:hypothetical protein [Nonomuraea sp.]